MIMLDFYMMILMFMFVLMILSGFFSLAERKMLALVQLRMGPGLFLFGLLTPMTDGMKLFMKFMLFMMGFDMTYFLISITMTMYTMYLTWFLLPLGFIIFFDTSFTMLMMMSIHMVSNVFSMFLVGCFLFCSCFMYLATIRILFFAMLSESSLNILYYTYYSIDFYSYFSVKDLNTTQLYLSNIYTLGLLFFMFFCMTTMLDCLSMPWEYAESESELVAGIVTEFSGFFFIVYSLLEMNHILMSSLLMSMLLLGGLFLTMKMLIIIFFVFLYPSSMACSIKMTTAHTFMLIFLFILNMLFFIWMSVMKVMMILI